MEAILDLSLIDHFFQSKSHQTDNKPFYDLYVKRWGDGRTKLTWGHFQVKELQQMQEIVTWIENNFDNFVKRFYENTKLVPKPIIFKPFIGNYLSSGWAEYVDNKSIVYFGIECYRSRKQMEVFFYHEFAHGYHLATTPDFRIVADQDFYAISRNIILEGIATFITKKVLNSNDLLALWGNNKEPFYKEWYESCMKTEEEMFDRLKLDLNKLDKNVFFHWFGMEEHTLGREGYFIGLQFIKDLHHNVNSLQQVMNMPLKEATVRLNSFLGQIKLA